MAGFDSPMKFLGEQERARELACEMEGLGGEFVGDFLADEEHV